MGIRAFGSWGERSRVVRVTILFVRGSVRRSTIGTPSLYSTIASLSAVEGRRRDRRSAPYLHKDKRTRAESRSRVVSLAEEGASSILVLPGSILELCRLGAQNGGTT